ncbi:MAG: hypothetical protein IPP77_10235 [Bacteroidetes bacterium]|nr:hypothetical protein [Bacteroidota bacterium]
MKSKIITGLIVLLLGDTLNLLGQDDQQKVVQSFNFVVEKFSAFIQTSHKLVYKQAYTNSPTGILVYILEYKGSNLSFDIKRTESIISPFLGYIEIDFEDRSNARCGNVSFSIKNYTKISGWDNEQEAINFDTVMKCYEPQLDMFNKPEKSFIDRIQFVFAYQDGKWIFKETKRIKTPLPPQQGLGD